MSSLTPTILSIQNFETTHLESDIYELNSSIRWEWYNRIILRYFERMPDRSFIAIKNGKIIGYIILDLKPVAPERKVPYVPFMAVHLHEHHSGVGTLLMLEALKKTHEIGQSLLRLECLPSRCSFYQSISNKAQAIIEGFSITYDHFISGSYPNGDEEHSFIFNINPL